MRSLARSPKPAAGTASFVCRKSVPGVVRVGEASRTAAGFLLFFQRMILFSVKEVVVFCKAKTLFSVKRRNCFSVRGDIVFHSKIRSCLSVKRRYGCSVKRRYRCLYKEAIVFL